MSTTSRDGRTEGSAAPRRGRRTLHWSFAYPLAALACLIQWGQPSPWSRLDLFTVGYLALRAMPAFRKLLRRRRVHIPAESQKERRGMTSSPRWVNWAGPLTVADLSAVLDYGHLHLVPGLEKPALQALGLVLYVGVAFWQLWTDDHLHAAFAGQTLRPRLAQGGPFGYVRHPRYAGAMAGKIAAALVFASVLGWIQVVLWSLLLLRQVRLEEIHMRQLFGGEYEEYSRRTARLLPGVY